jgi:DNA-binding PadR family transcriptional regulator
MSLPHAILGFLHYQPMTGYDLKTQCFDDSIAYFWPADQAQIYRTLDKMTEQGWVESRLEVQEDRPNRKIYSITEAGRIEMQNWLMSEQALPAHREPFLVQLFFAGQLPNADIKRLVQARLQAHEALLARYRGITIPDDLTPSSKREARFQQMTLDLGLRMEQLYIDWLEDCKTILETL